ncbi:hypothetical protein DK926_18780 [Rhodococcus sp. Eu-32]|uniref:hypothetical protein n=1 Tax=Rhodococcus sp. Eu-32 TaxID=1017319 RepID=UPI000F79EC14|nr:hypothetical protein [Rhodococcus sp. Eu-32]RRQ26293.1 hypothetical protein DK926_18780 [Rhodococcus sp. Eu-32]
MLPVGTIVHFIPIEGVCALPLAAIIVGNSDITASAITDKVALCVLQLDGLYFAENVPHSVDPLPGHWTEISQFKSVDMTSSNSATGEVTT